MTLRSVYLTALKLIGEVDYSTSESELSERAPDIGAALCREAAALDRPIIVMLHYPPLDDPAEGSPFTELIGRYPAVTDCVYGHIHGDKAPAFEGVYRGVRYQNCSIDRLDFTPRLIAEE